MTRSTTILRAVLTAVVAVCPLASSTSSAQTPGGAQRPEALQEPQGRSDPSRGTAAAGQSPSMAAEQNPPPKPEPPDVYTYNPEGRRDPFVSLLFRGSDLRPARESRPEGLPGLLISEIAIRGIVKDKMGYVAMVSGPDNKTHIIRGNDKVYDGSVKAIMADSVIFSQDVNDPLSLVKQREVRKYLRATQEGK